MIRDNRQRATLPVSGLRDSVGNSSTFSDTQVSAPTQDRYGKNVKWTRWHRARTALLESSKTPYQVRIMFEYLLSKQGTHPHAHPSGDQMAQDLGISKTTARKWVAMVEEAMAPVFTAKRIGKHNGGKHKNSYICLDFHNWPDDFVVHLEAGLWKNSRPQKPTMADKQFEVTKQLAGKLKGAQSQQSTPSVNSVKTTLSDSAKSGLSAGKIDQKLPSYMELVNGADINGTSNAFKKPVKQALSTPRAAPLASPYHETKSVTPAICPVCEKPIVGSGFVFNKVLLCERDGECHQNAHEAVSAPPDIPDPSNQSPDDIPW